MHTLIVALLVADVSVCCRVERRQRSTQKSVKFTRTEIQQEKERVRLLAQCSTV